MIPIQQIRSDLDSIKSSLGSRGVELNLDQMLRVDDDRKMLINELDTLRAERNIVSQEIGEIKKDGETQKGQSLPCVRKEKKFRSWNLK